MNDIERNAFCKWFDSVTAESGLLSEYRFDSCEQAFAAGIAYVQSSLLDGQTIKKETNTNPHATDCLCHKCNLLRVEQDKEWARTQPHTAQ